LRLAEKIVAKVLRILPRMRMDVDDHGAEAAALYPQMRQAEVTTMAALATMRP
jgi:hypothetical protein